MALNTPGSSGVLDNASHKVPQSQPEPHSLLRWIIGIVFLILAGANAIGVTGAEGRSEALVISFALAIWGIRAIIGPAPLHRIRWFDALVYASYIPLPPFYLNLGAEALWGDEWGQVSPALRIGLLATATAISTLLVTIAWTLHVHEVRRFRSSYLRDTIYAVLDAPAWRHLSYIERSERGDDLRTRWGKVGLPLHRCELLIRAGIDPQAAKKSETKALTDENLQAMAWMLSTHPGESDRC